MFWHAKLSFNVGPGGQVLIPTEIDYTWDFSGSDHELWDTEYATDVKATEWLSGTPVKDNSATEHNLTDYALPYDLLYEFEKMEPEERQFILDELAGRPELWDEESEVMFL